MYEIKNVLALIATLLVFVGYVPYFKNVIKGKTKPHLYSWLVWSLVSLIIFALQISNGAGAGALVTLATTIMCVTVIVLSFVFKSRTEITKIDTIFLILAIISLGLWLITKQPILSTVMATIVDLLAFAPTIRKSWNNPHTETVSYYFVMSLRFGLAILALQKYSIVTAFYPATWLIVESLFALVLIVRQKQIPEKVLPLHSNLS